MYPLPEHHDRADAAMGDQRHRIAALGTVDPGRQESGVPPIAPQSSLARPASSETALTAPGYSSELFPASHAPDPFDLPIHEQFRRLPYHCRRMRGHVDIDRILRDHGHTLLRSDIGLLPDGRREVYRALLNPADGLFLQLEESELAVYSASANAADQ